MLTNEEPTQTPSSRKLSWAKLPQAALLLITVTAVFVSYGQACSWAFLGLAHPISAAICVANDKIDVPPLLLRVTECKNFIQTRSYWHEEYTPNVIFYRPLSLTWFWLQYRFFGPSHFEYWTLVSVIIDICFCGLFALLVKDISGSWTIATLTVLIFAGIRSTLFTESILAYLDLYGVAPTMVAVNAWKDQPTLIADSLTVLSMLFALRAKWVPALLTPIVAGATNPASRAALDVSCCRHRKGIAHVR